MAIPGYDRLADTKVIAHLSQLSQKRMEAVETYERARRGRRFVLERLRYPRTDEALEGYDALTAEQMPAALEDADLATVNRVRAYERKLRRRERVLAQIDRVRQQLRGPGNTPGAAPPTRR